jgi:outer membrane immunogenic protein
MRKVVIAVVAALGAMSAPAMAADMPVKAPPIIVVPAYNWTGFYVGGNAGWVGSRDSNILITGSDNGTFGLGALLAAGAIPSAINLPYHGFLGGITAGYNWQFHPRWVVGIEGDFDWAAARGSSSFGPVTSGFLTVTTPANRQLDTLATVRGRIGFIPWSPNLMLFATAGLAIERSDFMVGVADAKPPGFPDLNLASVLNSTSYGGTAGGGIEWAFWRNWSLKAEYLYVWFNSTTGPRSIFNYGPFTSAMTPAYQDRFNIVRGGINFHF